MIDVTCRCGHISHSEEQHIGKHLRCPKCGEPVPILHIPRAIVQPPTTSPRTQTNQSRARTSPRFRPFHAVAVVIAVIVLTGSWLIVHFQSHVKEKSAGTASVADAGEAAAQTREAKGAQTNTGEDQTVKWEIVDVVPPSPMTNRTPSSASEKRVPPVVSQDEEVPSLPNGARIAPDVGIDGHGELNVNNGTAQDAEIILYNVERDEQARDVNVRAHDLFQIAGIPVGTYELKYALGSSFYQFERSLDYIEQRTEEADRVGVNYKEISVTLHSVVGGNVRTKQISRSDFLKGRPAARSLNAHKEQ
jgi:hypothetical protein